MKLSLLPGKIFTRLTLLFAVITFITSCKKSNPIPAPVTSVFDHIYTVSDFAGSTFGGFKDGTAATAQFNMRYGIAADSLGNIYIADAGNNSIRKVSAGGVVSTLAGNGMVGAVNGNGKDARFNFPQGLTVDAAGNVYVADTFNNQIRKVTPDGVVSTIAGAGTPGNMDGNGKIAQFNAPTGITLDVGGNLLVTDFNNGLIRKITTAGQVKTLPGIKLSGPVGIVTDASKSLYVVESGKSLIRKITPPSILTTIAGTEPGGFADGRGTGALFSSPEGITRDGSGNLYVSDLGNNCIRKITPAGMVSTVAGGAEGYVNGAGPASRFAAPSDVAIDRAGNIYVVDVNNHRIRKIQK